MTEAPAQDAATPTLSSEHQAHLEWLAADYERIAAKAEAVKAKHSNSPDTLAGLEERRAYAAGRAAALRAALAICCPPAWTRYRFYESADDARPVLWPMPGPYWITGYTGDGERTIIVAYLPEGTDLMAYWPDAEEVEAERVDRIVFSSRFPRPSWWEGSGSASPAPPVHA